jgi:hypothetical protein
LASACRDGDRPAADAALVELAGLMKTEPQTLAFALRRWLTLPPTMAELKTAIEADTQLVRDAEAAELVF